MASEIVAIFSAAVGLPAGLANIKQYMLDPIKAQFNYVRQYSDIMKRLGDKNEELKSRRAYLQQWIQATQDNLQNIDPNVDKWCTKVDQRTQKIDRILADEPRVPNDSCLQGRCTSLKLRYSRGRKATKLNAHIVKLLDEYKEFDVPINYPAPRTLLVTSAALEFNSRKQIEEEIMSYLKNPSIRMIGVWGMGGVGKTTMAKKIRERASEEKLFGRTAMAVVSQQVEQLKIQQDLAQDLGLDLTMEETVYGRATKLSTRLMNEEVLIILDDVWKELNLELVGIPSQAKLLLTTRNCGVCRSMCTEEATRILELRCLVEGEDFALFCKHAGHVVHQSNLRPLAMEVASKCKGLPLALKTVGVSLTGVKDVSIWEASLRQLQRAAPEGIDGYLEGVYRPLELSYDRLESDEDKNLFLLCCLFPEDSNIEIEDLVRYVVGLPNFSATESIIEARDKVNLIVRRLVARCLLMDAGEESCPTYVKMHDIFRDMALSIASTGEHKFKVSHDKGLREWPHESYTCISLTLGEATFQEGMQCPGLKALLLTFDLSSTTPMLPGNFLNGMAYLTLLSINGRHWSSNHVFRLPLLFLSSLTKLRVLLLHNCHFEDTDISFLGQVKDLEILSCRGSDIQELPNEIIDLTKLKLLDMTGCRKLKNIAPGVITALVKLEELCLMGCPIEWDRQETGDERRTASLAEVFSLKNLSILEVWIKHLEVISQKMDYSPRLTSYSISIGREGGKLFWRRPYNNPKRMSVCVDERMAFPGAISKLIEDVKELKLKGNGCNGIIELLGREGFVNITSLEIDRLGDVKILVEPMNRVIFPNLRHLKLSSMNEFEEICNGHPQVGSFSELKKIVIFSCAKLKWVFPLSIAESLSKLESIDVRDCPVVEEVFNGHPQVGSFSELKKITIDGCAKLKWVFPLSIAESLCKLESIDVSDCPVMEEVFKESESGITAVKFPNVKNMELRGLPGLGAWCKAVDAIIEFPSIESLDISAVPSNFKIFGNLQLDDQVITCTKLKYLRMDNLGMEIFYREVPIGFFSGIKKLEIESFHRLRVLFSLIVFKDLVNLKKLIVVDCVMLENIVEMENEDKKHTNVTIQKLEELQLSKLPICYFWPFTCALEFPSLETVSITDCPKMEAFAVVHSSCSSSIPKFFGHQVTFTKLKEVTMSHFSMETSSHNLKTLFSPAIFRALVYLRKLTVEDCMMLKDIVEMEKDEDEGHRNNISKISPLKELKLSKLPNIRYFGHFSDALEFPSLKKVIVEDCAIMETFVVVSNALEFPSLEEVTIEDCPKMETFVVGELGSSSSMSSGSIPERNFFTKQVTFTKLKELTMSHSIMEISPIGFFSGLETLQIESFHSLRILFSPAILKALGNLQKLTVKDCEMLEDIVEMEKDEDEGQKNNISKISHLKLLELSKLPKIRYFGHFSDASEFPSLKKVTVEDCAIMETFVVVSNALEFPSLEEVTIEDCPKMETFVVGELGSSSSMSSGSIPERNFFTKQVTFTKLKELTMSHFSMEISPIGFFSGLETLHIESFHSLRILFSPAILKALGNLQKLTVKDCEMLEDIVEMEKDEDEGQKNNISKISPLKKLKLSKLPKIRYFGPFSDALEFPSLKKVTVEDCAIMETFVVVSNALEFPSLEEVTIEDCPKMETFVVGELGSSSSMSNGSIPERNFFTKQVTCPKLQSLTLEGLKISGLLFSPETPIASLGALCVLEIKSCHNLKSLFTSRMFEGLTSLEEVSVTNCSLFEEVIAKDDDDNENVDEMVVNIPKVESLQLRELPKLRYFCHTRRDLELSSVQLIDLRSCTEIMKSSFCLGGRSVRIPAGVRVQGISDPEFASQFFFSTQSLDFIQHLQEEDTLDDGCFMLLSSDLSFTWDSNEDLSVVKGTSNAFFVDGWKKACGKFDMEKLLPEITYEIVFVIMLFKLPYCDKDDQLETMMGDDKREHEVKNVPRQEWIEILVGELTPSSGQCGDITFSLQKNNNETRVALKFASIRPKRIASDAR